MQEHILFVVQLGPAHLQESASLRFLSGSKCYKRPYELRIIRYDDDKNVYLIEYDENFEEIIDTLHDNISDAMKQAQFDWGIQPSDWNKK
jgi:hypothetical protein